MAEGTHDRRENQLATLARIPVVRRLWAAITISSLGDWLGLLANTALAQQLTHSSSVSTQGAAISGVLLVRLAPDLFFGPVAAALADKVDRRKLVIVADLTAGLLYASIAIGYNLVWLYVAQFLIEAVGLFSQPAKQVIQTTIVPKRLLATANQISLFSVYGTVPVAAGIFALLSAGNRIIGGANVSTTDGVNVAIVIALLLDTASFLVSSGTVFLSRRDIPVLPADRERSNGILALLREGVVFVRHDRLIRALYVGVIGAFAAGGLTVGVAQLWVATLDAGNAGYSIMFGTLFTGLALGMLLGPKVLPSLPRSRVFGLAIGGAGVTLVIMSLIRDFILADALAAGVGLFAGMAWIVGYTLIGQEVEDRLRGRTFAFVLSSVRLMLLLTIAVGPILAGGLGTHTLTVGDDARLTFSGPGLTLLIGGVLALGVSLYATSRAGGRHTRLRDLARRRLLGAGMTRHPDHTGLLLTVDGPDADVTGRYASLLADRVRTAGYVVTETAEPYDAAPVEPETAALRSAAERSEHVAHVIRPALERGEVVVCDRYVLTSLALHGGGRGADVDRIRAVNAWATGGLRADLVLVADPGDRTDGEDGVRTTLLDVAASDPDRLLVVTGGADTAELPPHVVERLTRLLRARTSLIAHLDAVVTDAGSPVAEPEPEPELAEPEPGVLDAEELPADIARSGG